MLRLDYDRPNAFESSTLEYQHQYSKSEQSTIKLPNIKSIGDYQLVRTIGVGSTGKVKQAINIRTKEQVAIKIIPRAKYQSQNVSFSKPNSSKDNPKIKEQRIMREAAILHLINHRHIVKLLDFLVGEEYFCMIFEYIEGMQLLDYIVKHKRLKETEARRIFKQILSAVDYCHQNGIVHRDLKIENILIEKKSNDTKLVDFGLSNFWDYRDKLGTFCGSLYFAAPELLHGHLYCGPEIDIWSLGIILFVLVTGKVPFDDKSLPGLHQKIKSCQTEYPKHISPQCRHLLEMMIVADPKRRATLDEVKSHVWTRMDGQDELYNYMPDRNPLVSIDPKVVGYLVDDFGSQYSLEDIDLVLNAAIISWNSMKSHPIVCLYYLAMEKLAEENNKIKGQDVHVRYTNKSYSCTEIPKQLIEQEELRIGMEEEMEELRTGRRGEKNRNMTITIPTRSTSNKGIFIPLTTHSQFLLFYSFLDNSFAARFERVFNYCLRSLGIKKKTLNTTTNTTTAATVNNNSNNNGGGSGNGNTTIAS